MLVKHKVAHTNTAAIIQTPHENRLLALMWFNNIPSPLLAALTSSVSKLQC